MNSEVTLPSFAKINLTLRVAGKREDGFHEIFTIFQTVSLCDEITFSKSEDISISCDRADIPTDESNLIYKAISALGVFSGKNSGVRVELKKRIPAPGGLGGGSSNAAVALIGVSRLWGLEVSIEELAEIGATIGSDVPFFLYGGTAFGTGRGTIIEEVPEFKKEHAIIVAPNVPVKTSETYSKLDLPHLTKNETKSILKHYREVAQALYAGQFEFKNDFEAVVFSSYREIENAADDLRNMSASVVSLSGTGPSVFGFFEDSDSRDNALRFFEKSSSISCYPIKMISGQTYQGKMGLRSS
jgi:4-diphosphocytidyl-2-C-methyl-D-erythritol kinase